jgi:putative phosphotransacetylase
MKIPVEVSARHIHISLKDLESLFGENYKLTKLRNLTQPSDFAAKETLDVEVNGKTIKNVRIVGPIRKKTQIEISLTDAVYFGIKPVLRNSGDIKDSPSAFLIGPKKRIRIKEGLIVPLRHIHCNFDEAKKLGLKNGDFVSVMVNGKRSVVFNNVKIRVRDDYKLCLHLDTDEGNAAGVNKKTYGFIIKNYKTS